MTPPRNHTEFAALTSDFRRRLKEQNDVPGHRITVQKFTDFCRHPPDGQQKISGNIEHKWWAQLGKGKAVPRLIVEAFVRYVLITEGTENRWQGVTLQSACARMPAPLRSNFETLLWSWESIQLTIGRLFPRYFAAGPDMFIPRGRKDDLIRKGARMVMDCAGRLTADPDDKSSHIERAAREMRITEENYCAWLLSMYEKQPLSMMFATRRTKGRKYGPFHKVAFCSSLGLKPASADRIVDGTFSPFDMTPDDLRSPSTDVFVHACGIDHDLLAVVGERESALAQLHCLLYQAAYLTRNTNLEKVRLITIAANEQFESRLLNQGFYGPGAVEARTRKRIMVLDNSKNSGYGDHAAYIGLLRLYVGANGRQWKREDKRVT